MWWVLVSAAVRWGISIGPAQKWYTAKEDGILVIWSWMIRLREVWSLCIISVILRMFMYGVDV